MVKVLIIEDQSAHYLDTKKEFEKYQEYFDVYPKNDNDTGRDLNNKGFLIDTLLDTEQTPFDTIADYYPDTDLFIIDATLYPSMNDRVGIDFLNFLKKSNYRNCKFNFIVTSQHNLENIGTIYPDFDSTKQYVSKDKWGTSFPEEIVRLSLALMNLQPAKNAPISANQVHFWDQRWWISLPDRIEKQVLHRFNLFIFYVSMLSTGIFALFGVCSETISLVREMITPETGHSHATKILEYVEHIFLYLLPLFIVFSFLSYYKFTMEIKLTGGNTRNIDHDGAMKSLNNSKFILLSSLLSFTIIKIIEKIFEDRAIPDTLSLIAFGGFMVILMIFILLQHKHANEKKQP